MESPEMKGGDVWNSNTKYIGSKFISRRERGHVEYVHMTAR